MLSNSAIVNEETPLLKLYVPYFIMKESDRKSIEFYSLRRYGTKYNLYIAQQLLNNPGKLGLVLCHMSQNIR